MAQGSRAHLADVREGGRAAGRATAAGVAAAARVALARAAGGAGKGVREDAEIDVAAAATAAAATGDRGRLQAAEPHKVAKHGLHPPKPPHVKSEAHHPTFTEQQDPIARSRSPPLPPPCPFTGPHPHLPPTFLSRKPCIERWWTSQGRGGAMHT